MKDYITIYVKKVESENAYRIWGENHITNDKWWMPGLSSDESGIPDGVRLIADNLIKKVDITNQLKSQI